MDQTLDILFEDNHCLAVNKPPGLPTQAAPGVLPTLESLVRNYLKEKYQKVGRVYLGIPHRLDRPVSGVVLFARQTKSAQRLAAQFHDRTVTKVYWAVVEGDLLPKQGSWEDWLRKVPNEARAEQTEEGAEGAKQARLRYRKQQSLKGNTLLEIDLETGRMHQIRLQAALRGHPVLGDVLYGSSKSFGPSTEDSSKPTIALHARSLSFRHPIRYEPITVVAPLPLAWESLGVGWDGSGVRESQWDL